MTNNRRRVSVLSWQIIRHSFEAPCESVGKRAHLLIVVASACEASLEAQRTNETLLFPSAQVAVNHYQGTILRISVLPVSPV